MLDDSDSDTFGVLAELHLKALAELLDLRGRAERGEPVASELAAGTEREEVARRQLLRWTSPSKERALDKLAHLFSSLLVAQIPLSEEELDALRFEHVFPTKALRRDGSMF